MYTSEVVFMQTVYQADIHGLNVSRISIKTSMDTKCISLHVSMTLQTPAHACTHTLLSSYMNTVVLTIFQLKSY